MDIEWILTLAGAAISAGLLGFAVWKDGQPKRDTIKTRWISWKFVMFLSAALLLLALVHAANKLGFHTGRNGPGFT